MRNIYAEDVLAIINKSGNKLKNKPLYQHIKLSYNGDVADTVRCEIFNDAPGEMAGCLCEHYSEYYIKKLNLNEGIKY
jgi:hypothetical protein